MSESFLAIARVAGPHGLRGEVKANILTDFPERFHRTREVWLGSPPTRFLVQRARPTGRQVILKLEGIDTREQVEAWRGQLVQVPESEAVALPPGQYFWHQVIGLEVRGQDQRPLGRIREILQTGSNDVYVVQGEQGEWLLPATREVIKEIDPERGLVSVELLPGMGPQA